MVDKQKKSKKKHTISEEDTLSILERYSAVTVMRLLAEITDNPGEKLDWNKLVNKTQTGISNAREYQMLWRHIAYGDALLDKVEDGAQPLDDDSDLECEIEVFPNVSAEATSEAAACVKVLAASIHNESNAPSGSTIEAPLVISVPNRESFQAPSDSESSQSSGLMQRTYVTIPVYVPKQNGHTTTTFTEVLDAKGPASCAMPAQRKRKPWSTEEDEALKSAAKKYGEGNWANIVKEKLMEGRTASQLSQRWSILKKKDTNLESGGHEPSPHLSEAQQAARHAMSVAINGPRSLKETCINNQVNRNLNSSVGNSNTFARASLTSISSSQGQNQTDKGELGSTEKSQVVAKKPLEKSNFVSESIVRATAVAAGARIATPSDAALLLKAAQSKNAVHIKSSQPRLATAPVLTKVAVTPGSVKSASSTVKPNPSNLAISSGQSTAIPSSRATQGKIPKLGIQIKQRSQAEGASAPGINPTERIRVDKAVLPKPEAESRNQVTDKMEED